MGGSVLIIDGDQEFAESAQNALEAAGITVHVRPDASLDVIRSLRPHVLLVNVELPRGSGFSICSRIRRDKTLRDTPILLTSSDTPVAALKRHAESPDRANDYAKKPIEIASVVARIGKLLEIAPERDEPEPETPTETAPPAQPSAAGAPPPMPTGKGPPPMPPKLKRTDAGGGGAQSNLQGEELWPQERFDETMRGPASAGTAEVRLKGRSTPEERIDQLRQQVKQLETQRRAVQEAWNDIGLRGQELARKVVALGADAQKKDERLAKLTQAAEENAVELKAVQDEFRAFQEEITRIFQEKDGEEQTKQAHLQEMADVGSGLQSQLQQAQERQVDDERRLQIMAEELDFLQNEKDQIDGQLVETTTALEGSNARGAELKARLETTETVADERADQIDQLRDKLDDLSLETDQTRRVLEEDHADQLANLSAEHIAELTKLKTTSESAFAELKSTSEAAFAELKSTSEAAFAELEASSRAELSLERSTRAELYSQLEHDYELQIADLKSSHEAEIEASRSRHAGLQESLNAAHESEIEALSTDLGEAQTRLSVAQEGLQSTELELEALREDAENVETRLRTEIDGLRSGAAQVLTRFEAANAQNQALETERVELEQELDETADALRQARTQAADLEQKLSSTETTASTEQVRLQTLLDSERSESEQRTNSLEAELEQSQTEFFERLSQLDAARAELGKLEQTHQQTGQQLETTAHALEASEATLAEAEAEAKFATEEQTKLSEQVDRLEAQHTRLEATVRQSHQMLEDERARLRELEDQVRQGTATEADLRETVQELEDEVETERVARNETQNALDAHQRNAAEQEAQVARLEAAKQDIEQHCDDEASARAEVTRALETTKTALQSTEADLHALQSSHTDALRSAETSRREKDAEIARLNRNTDKALAEQARLQTSLESERSQSAQAMGEHEDTQNQLLDVAQNRDRAEAKVRQLERELRSADRKTESLQTQIDGHTSAQGDAQAEIAAIQRAKDEAMASVEAQGAADRAAGEDLRRALGAMTRERDALQVTQSTLQAQVDQQTAAASAADSDPGATNEEVELWQGHVSELKINVEALQARLAVVEGERDELRSQSTSTQRDAPLRRRLTTAEKEIRTLKDNEEALSERAEDAEEKLAEARFTQESIRSTLQAMERDLSQEQQHQKGFTAQYDLVLGKVSRALGMTLEVLDSYDDMAAATTADPTPDVLPVIPELFEYTGEVEALEPDGVTDSSPFPKLAPTANGPRTGGSAVNIHSLGADPAITREVTPEEPFADLVRELRAAADSPIVEDDGPPTYTGPRQSFTESFAAESTRADHHPLSGHARPPGEVEEDERNVTEIIDLSDFE